MSRRHRLFFALYPEVGARQALWKNVEDQLPEKQGRAVLLDNLHMTLVFVGSCSDSDLACLQSCLDQAIPLQGFDIQLDHLGYWKRPKILWAGCSHPPKALFTLVGLLRDRIRKRCDLPIESREYRPHVTLMRKIRPEDGQALQNASIQPVDWHFTHVHLMESISEPSGVRYISVKQWKMGGRD